MGYSEENLHIDIWAERVHLGELRESDHWPPEKLWLFRSEIQVSFIFGIDSLRLNRTLLSIYLCTGSFLVMNGVSTIPNDKILSHRLTTFHTVMK